MPKISKPVGRRHHGASFRHRQFWTSKDNYALHSPLGRHWAGQLPTYTVNATAIIASTWYLGNVVDKVVSKQVEYAYACTLNNSEHENVLPCSGLPPSFQCTLAVSSYSFFLHS